MDFCSPPQCTLFGIKSNLFHPNIHSHLHFIPEQGKPVFHKHAAVRNISFSPPDPHYTGGRKSNWMNAAEQLCALTQTDIVNISGMSQQESPFLTDMANTYQISRGWNMICSSTLLTNKLALPKQPRGIVFCELPRLVVLLEPVIIYKKCSYPMFPPWWNQRCHSLLPLYPTLFFLEIQVGI